MKNKSELV